MPKTNLRVIPKSIRIRLNSLKGRSVIAACSRLYSAKELEGGKLRHLGIELSKGKLSYVPAIVPPERSGKYSFKNVNGEEIKRTDLKKETHYNAIESPNWGDSYKGTHTVYLPYAQYPRDFIGPRFTQLKLQIPNSEDGHLSYLIVFEVDRVLDQNDKKFDESLLECLNLLQENVRFCGIQGSGATVADYLQTLKVSWEVLPPGTKEEALARLFRGKSPSAKERSDVEELHDFLMSLKPSKLIYGTSGLERYFGGLIQEDLVVFENIQYGNAIYIMFDNWKDLSQRTRTELLSGRFGNNFERVKHGSGWKQTVKAIIKERLAPKDPVPIRLAQRRRFRRH
jgi:hypothetical protein